MAPILGHFQGRDMEARLGRTSEVLFPAAQRGQEVEAAFQRMVKNFGDAVLMQDTAGLERADGDAKQVTDGLNSLAAIADLAELRRGEARRLATSSQQFITDARTVYGAMMGSPSSMTAETQDRVRRLATRSDDLKASLVTLKDDLSRDLHQQLSAAQSRSAQQRWLTLVLFGFTLIVAAVLVNLAVRRGITNPIRSVIDGVRSTAEESARLSAQVAESGEVVARDAQDQAACIQETSASLNELTATTKENADRANEVNKLMGDSSRSVGEAANAMQQLKSSMDLISKSSRQVSDVLQSIDEIAFHTNILALNAAVEAARAGEVGAGFSVVADEVRSLAHRASDAAKRSAEIIEKTLADVSDGVKFVGVAHESFSVVSATISEGTRAVAQIASSNAEQARGIGQVSEAITRIESVTQKNAANARQTAGAAMAMGSQVRTTREHLQELAALIGSH